MSFATCPLPQRSMVMTAIAALLAVSPTQAATYEVGPGKPYASVNAVPLESLAAGDTVLIYWRSTPYREKWVITAQGAAGAPVVFRGVAGPGGALPIIDGENATTRSQTNYWSEARGVIKIGGSNTPPDVLPTYIVIENLDIRGARPPSTFTDDVGNVQSYPNNGAAVYIERGRNITVRNCIARECGNGLFVASSDDEAARDILIEGNYIHSNGNAGSIFEHNTYTAAIGIVYQFNRFGPLLASAGGNALKDRSAGLVVRYNWIEGGNRQLDLVDGEDSGLIRGDPAYDETFVYGNVLIEPAGAGNRQITHYGGDSGNEPQYRKGTLYFHHNTIVSTRSDRTTLFRLSTNDEACEARNNIFFTTHPGTDLSLLDDTGELRLSHNWVKPGWVQSFGGTSGVLIDDGTWITGTAPGFVDVAGQDFTLVEASPCVDVAGVLAAAVTPAHVPAWEYVKHQAGEPRTTSGPAADVGAFERSSGAVLFDANGDGMVTLADWPAMVACLAGPGVAPAGSSCLATFDADEDEDVDLRDASAFARSIYAGG